ncbi:MAG: lectin-like domain-containing protein [Chitinophagaceae bacterium]
MMQLRLFSFLLLLVLSLNIHAQYVLNGAATKNSCNCYTLTPAEGWKSGSVWNSQKINLNNPFDFKFNVFLGCSNSPGADGIVFMLQPNSTSIGSSGEGMGFDGISPSVGIALDTWQNFNLNDPEYDHISIQLNGNVNHNFDLAGPVPASATSNDIEDCKWHKLRITWDPLTKWYRAYFNDVLRVEAQIDLIANVFNNDPFVFWGFSAATGGEWNLQQFCTALNPEFKTISGNLNACEGSAVLFADASESFTNISSYMWSFGDGTTSNVKDPPPHIYNQPGIYPVTLNITALDGCTADSVKLVTIGSKPIAEFSIDATCEGKTVTFQQNVEGIAINYLWLLNDQPIVTDVITALAGLSAGNHKLHLTATSAIGCGTEKTTTQIFNIKPKPVIDHYVDDGCINENVSLEGIQSDANTIITSWHWLIDNKDQYNQQNLNLNFSSIGNYALQTWAQAENGCYSDTLNAVIYINQAVASAGRDTMILNNVPFTLNGSGNGNFNWSPETGLNNPFLPNPTAVLFDDQDYLLTVTTPEGCIATDSVKIEVFKNSAVFVPNAFTPNGDGLNDVFKPFYSGIKKLFYFYVYNRWGQPVYKTTSTQGGWDGKIGASISTSGTYVWILKAEDLAGKIYNLKGTVSLIN